MGRKRERRTENDPSEEQMLHGSSHKGLVSSHLDMGKNHIFHTDI
jgi:hypothetical protein